MRKDVREFIRRLEAAGLTVEPTPRALPRAARREAVAQSQRHAVHASLLSRHDPLAPIRNQRTAPTRHPPLRAKAGYHSTLHATEWRFSPSPQRADRGVELALAQPMEERREHLCSC